MDIPAVSIHSAMDILYHIPTLSSGGHNRTLTTLIETAKFNSINPEAYLCAAIARIAQHPMRKIHELLPWNITL